VILVGRCVDCLHAFSALTEPRLLAAAVAHDGWQHAGRGAAVLDVALRAVARRKTVRIDVATRAL